MEATIIGTAQSSVYELDGIQYPASKLVDGKGLDGIFNNENGCASTKKYANGTHWFSLELDIFEIVTKVQIARRMDRIGVQGSNVDITIGYSRNYDSNDSLCLPKITHLELQTGLVDYICTGSPKKGKYVKISSSSSETKHLCICEAKIFVRPAGSGGCSFHYLFIFNLYMSS